MTARPDITDPQNMLAIQGDRIAVYTHTANGDLALHHILTLVRVIDGDCQSLRMVNRESRSRQPDLAFSQKWYGCLRPAGENKLNVQWAVTLKARP